MFILIYQAGTDGELQMEIILGKDKVASRVEALRLTRWDYAVVQGQVLKNFDQQDY